MAPPGVVVEVIYLGVGVVVRLPDYIALPYHDTVQPLVSVPASHALLVIALYGVLFATTAIILTQRRDVLD